MIGSSTISKSSAFLEAKRVVGQSQMVDPYRASRQFERKIFRGVSEHPETASERDRNANVPERQTGTSQNADRTTPQAQHDWELIGTIFYDSESTAVENSGSAEESENQPAKEHKT